MTKLLPFSVVEDDQCRQFSWHDVSLSKDRVKEVMFIVVELIEKNCYRDDSSQSGWSYVWLLDQNGNSLLRPLSVAPIGSDESDESSSNDAATHKAYTRR